VLASGRGEGGLHFVVGEQIHQKGESELPLAVHFLNPCILKRSPAAARSIAKHCLCSIAIVKVLPGIAFVVLPLSNYCQALPLKLLTEWHTTNKQPLGDCVFVVFV